MYHFIIKSAQLPTLNIKSIKSSSINVKKCEFGIAKEENKNRDWKKYKSKVLKKVQFFFGKYIDKRRSIKYFIVKI